MGQPAIKFEADYETTVGDIKTFINHRHDDFGRTLRHALDNIEKSKSTNKAQAATLLANCIVCEQRGDVLGARLLLYTSGAIINPVLAEMVLIRVTDIVGQGGN